MQNGRSTTARAYISAGVPVAKGPQQQRHVETLTLSCRRIESWPGQSEESCTILHENMKDLGVDLGFRLAGVQAWGSGGLIEFI